MKEYKVSVFNTTTGKYELVEVTKEVYEVFTRTQWNLEDNESSFYEHQIPLSQLDGTEDTLEAWERFDEFVVECEIASRDEIEKFAKEQERKALFTALKSLKSAELELIEAIYFNGMTVKAYAEHIGKERSAVNKKKIRILSKLKQNILQNLK